eukprot:g6702.t1
MGRVTELFQGMDQDQSGRIHYMEFLAATLEASDYNREEILLHAFDRLDSDNSGAISRSNLKQLLGKDYHPELVDAMIREGDIKQNGKIDQDEFLEMMRRDKQRERGASLDLGAESLAS